jgi:tripartite-type tricarboxylate transporter receptor subunit TctC
MRISRAILLALLLLPVCALAQQSQKPIRIIVPFAPGASADGIARVVANGLGERLGRSVVVENVTGAGGSLGLQALAKAPPDGDTIGISATGALLINPYLPGSTSPEMLKELAPVAKLIEVGVILVAHPTKGPTSIQDLIAQSKARPEGLSYGSTGTYTGQHITMEMFKKATGANLTHIPYRGSTPAVVDVVAGQIPLAIVDITSAYPQVQAGKLRALGVGETKRSKAAPEIPTIAEGGVPGFGRTGGFIGLFAPAGTPPATIKRISAEVAEILKTPAAAANVKTLTATIEYEDDVTFGKFLNGEADKWKAVLKDLFK